MGDLNEQYRKSKVRAFLASKGIPAFVPAGPTRAHVEYLHTHPEGGMTLQEIADRAGMGVGGVCEIASGFRRGVPICRVKYETQQKILSVRYTGFTTPGGAWSDPTGTQRRIQALYAVGFSAHHMSELLEIGPETIQHILRHTAKVTARTKLRVKSMYDKLSTVDPIEYGAYPPAVNRMKNLATTNRWAPPSCWDDDTIDNPSAVPEWTGACGTVVGVEIHKREGIPECPACKEARLKAKRALTNADKMHTLSGIDPETKTADCNACDGRIDVIVQGCRGNQVRYRCGPHQRDLAHQRSQRLTEEIGRHTDCGLSAEAIAKLMGINVRTVTRHRTKIKEMLENG